MTGGDSPALSIIVVAWRMSRQAENALYSLSSAHQRNVRQSDYEVIVIENASEDLLGEPAAKRHGSNFRYFLNDDPRGSSPVHALNLGLERARGANVGVVLDGAHIFTPRIVEFSLRALRVPGCPVVAVPTYHLGTAAHHVAHAAGYDEVAEQKLLEDIRWKEDPGALFGASVFAPGARNGFLVPMHETACFMTRREAVLARRPEYERFDRPGGGHVAAYLYNEICKQRGSELYVLAGEGAFHQFHRGELTSAGADRNDAHERAQKELHRFVGGVHRPAPREAILLGVPQGLAHARMCDAVRAARMWHALREKWSRGPTDDQRRHAQTPELARTSSSPAGEGEREPERRVGGDVSAASAAGHGQQPKSTGLVEATVTGEATATPVVTPALSILVIVFRMPRQALNTIFTLGPRYQRGVSADDYEIIVVENRSTQCLDEDAVLRAAPNARYFLRDEPGKSPAAAINFGLSQCRGERIGLLIDGARMVTPRVVYFALKAFHMYQRPLVAAPGYHLGPDRQWRSSLAGYGEEAEKELLASVDWRSDGYELFRIACIDDTNSEGFFSPFIESNCFFFQRACFESIGGADERFVSPGGGILNLAIFNHMCRLPGTKLVLLPGEGSFHQYHGGVSTSDLADRERLLESFRQEYRIIYGHPLQGYDREPVLLGPIAAQSFPHLLWSSQQGIIRHNAILEMNRPEWPNEPEFAP